MVGARVGEWNSNSLTPEQADLIANQYFLCEQDRKRMGEALGLGRILDVDFLSNILVRQAIRRIVLYMRNEHMYSREEHLEMLKKIRNGCLNDENWKTALAAEIAVGKAAGLYENIGDPGDDPNQLPAGKPVEALTTDQIRARLTHLQSNKAETPIEVPAQEQIAEGQYVDVSNGDEAF